MANKITAVDVSFCQKSGSVTTVTSAKYSGIKATKGW